MDRINLVDKITNEEIEMLTNYRDWYAWQEDDLAGSLTLPIREILSKAWEPNNHLLYKLLGNQLIITKDFHYEKSVDELSCEIDEMIDGHACYGRTNRQGWRFIRNFYEWTRTQFRIPSMQWVSGYGYRYDSEEDEELAEKHSTIRDRLHGLISNNTLANNKYEEESFSIELKDGKKYMVSTGCKPMKVLAKIAEAYNIEGFEDFRICHSLIHNQKKVDGKISLSIHPLDYWTMSDNDCGWDSCMSWKNDGGYRQGTVEMMNSPNVVIAYISANDSMRIGSHDWNSKKWRQLFIVDQQCILGIKSYPYFNDELTIAITEWLKELAETNLGWKYFGDNENKPIKYNFQPVPHPDYPEGRQIRFSFYSKIMYTDVGCMDWHPLYIGIDVHEDGEHMGHNSNYYGTPVVHIDYNYSGASQCMSCGKLDPYLSCESSLCCEDCEESYRCEECGDSVDPDDMFYVDGAKLCSDCYDRCTEECFYSYERSFREDLEKIYLRLPVENPEDMELYYQHDKDVMFFLTEPIYVNRRFLPGFKEKYLLEDKNIKSTHIVKMNGTEAISYIDIPDLYITDDTIDRWDEVLPCEFSDEILKARETNDYSEVIRKFRFCFFARSVVDTPEDLKCN